MSEVQKDTQALPNSWQLTSIGDVADVIGGGTPATNEPGNFGGDIPWITPADMSHHIGKTIEKGARSISAKGLANSGARLLPKGSVLFSSRAPIGYTAIASQSVTTNQGFKSFIPATGVNSDYLYYWLTSAKPLAESLASGTTFLEISGAKAALIPFPFAPAAEQTRIVEKLEELLSGLDAGVAELKAAQKKLTQYRQSLLKAAVEGALTADWRAAQGSGQPAGSAQSAESGQALLARILTERRSRWQARQLAKFKAQGKTPPKDWQAKYPEPVAPDTVGLPALPPDWVWASLDCLIDEGPQNGLYLPATRYGLGCPILRIDDFQIGWARLRANLNLVDAGDETVATYALQAGDIVINRVNSMTHLGKSLVVNKSLDGVLFESNMMRSRLSSAIDAEYVGLYLGSEVGRNRLIRDAKWAVNQASINQQDVKKTPVPVPSFFEQKEISGVVINLLAAADMQAKAIAHSLRQSAAQRKNIFKAAFSGQLVPQDPNDEPASALLARIRAERLDVAGRGKKRQGMNKQITEDKLS